MPTRIKTYVDFIRLDDALEFRTDDDSAPWWIDAGEWNAQTDGMEKARDLLDKRIRWLRSRGRLDEVFTVKFPYAAARTLMLALKEVTEDREQWEDEEVDWVDARDIPAWRAQAAEMEDVLGELEEFGYRLRWSDRVR